MSIWRTKKLAEKKKFKFDIKHDSSLTSLGMSASVRLKKVIRHLRVAVTMALLPARPTQKMWIITFLRAKLLYEPAFPLFSLPQLVTHQLQTQLHFYFRSVFFRKRIVAFFIFQTFSLYFCRLISILYLFVRSPVFAFVCMSLLVSCFDPMDNLSLFLSLFLIGTLNRIFKISYRKLQT